MPHNYQRGYIYNSILFYRSSGLGLATAQSLHSSNAYICIIDLSPPPNSSFSESLTRIKYIQTDITSLPSIRSAVNDAITWSRSNNAPLGGVINCAGVGTAGKIIDAKNEAHSADLWDFSLDVNLNGAFNLTRLGLEHLVKVEPEHTEDGERGVIIFVSSAAAVRLRSQ